jgi:cell division protein FtsN
MKNNETGEFELVLGNRQLLSGFFIVVLLFGVAFAMGYIVGRNSTPSQRSQAEAAAGSAAPVPKERPEPAPAASTPPPAQTSTDSTPAAQQPAAETAASSAVTPPAQSTTPPAQPAAQPPSPATPPAPSAETPADAPPGSYWQVIATSNRTAAEALQQSLKDKGFPVTLGPGPNNLVRVLVGPYSDTQSMGRAKTLLEAAGLHPVRK